LRLDFSRFRAKRPGRNLPVSVMKLIVMRGESRGRSYLIEEGSNLIGRWDADSGAFPEIDLEDQDPENKVSRKHAIIEKTGGTVTIEDVGSRNGTYINRGPRLEEGVKHELVDGDEIVVGKVFMKFQTEDS